MELSQRLLNDRKTNASFIILSYMSTDDESLVKIGPVVAEIFGEICQFLPSLFVHFLQKFHKLPFKV